MTFKVVEIRFSRYFIRRDVFRKQQQQTRERKSLVEIAQRDQVDRRVVIHNAECRHDGEDDGGKDDPNDLSLLFGLGVSMEMLEDEP